MHKLQGKLLQMQRLDALLLGRGYSDLQVLTGYLRPGRESHSSGTPTRNRSLRPGYACIGHGSCSSRFNGLFFQPEKAAQTPPFQHTCLLTLLQLHRLLCCSWNLAGTLLPPHWLSPLSASFLQTGKCFTPSPPSGLSSKVPFTVRLTLTTLFIITTLNPPYHCP